MQHLNFGAKVMTHVSNIWHKWLKHSAQEGTVTARREQFQTVSLLSPWCNTDAKQRPPGTNPLLSPVPTSHASVGKAGIPTAPGNWQPLQYSFYWNDPSFEAMITNLLLASVSRRSSLALTCLIEDYSDISISNASIDTATYTGLCFSSQTVTKHGTEPDQTDTTFCLMSTFFISLITE